MVDTFGVVSQYYLSSELAAYYPDLWTLLKYIGVSRVSGAVRRWAADQAAQNNIKVQMQYTTPFCNPDNPLDFASKATVKAHFDIYDIAQYQNHPGVFGHQITGEPCMGYVFDSENPSAALLALIDNMRYACDYVRSLDPTHPAFVALDPAPYYGEDAAGVCTRKRAAWINLFIDFCDVLDFHYYRYHGGGGAGDEFWRNPTKIRSQIIRQLDSLISCSRGKPIVIGETGCPSGNMVDWNGNTMSFTQQQQADYFKLFGEETKPRGIFPVIYDLYEPDGDTEYHALFRDGNDGVMNFRKIATSLVKDYLSVGAAPTLPTLSVKSTINGVEIAGVPFTIELVSPPPPPPPPTNLILNPSVENGITSPDNWVGSKTSAITATLSWVSDAHIGVKAVRIDATYDSGVSVNESAYWRQSIAVTAGRTYRFRCWYKTSGITYAQPARLILLAVGASYNTQLNLPPSSSWIQSDWLNITIPSGVTELWADARIFNLETGSKYAVFDDFELEEV